MLGAGCPGASNLWGTPTLAIKKCPECGSEVEIFSSDVKVKCRKCGFVVFNDVQSCIEWCKYAEKCLGTPLYKQLKQAADMKKKREEAEKNAPGPLDETIAKSKSSKKKK
jgi:DNA-directed RNA polymerase subunit RPC12/RpoP